MNSNYLYYYPLAGASSMTFKDIDSYFSETHEIIRPASLDITNDAADAQESVGIYTDSNKFL